MIQPSMAITLNEIAAHYDSLDVFYRQIWGEHIHHGYWETGHESTQEATFHLSRVLAAWLDVKAGDEVCDLGCGYGGTSRYLAEAFKVHVTGYTISSRQKEFAESIPVSRGSVVFHCQDFLTNGRADDSFDSIISIECLEHIQDKQKVFDEAFRLLKAGGSMSLALWSSCENPSRMQRRTLEAICREGRLPSLPSGEEYEYHMLRSGFRIAEKREIGKKVRKTWSICVRNLAYRIVTDATYRSFLLDSEAKDRVFAITLFRILFAFRTMAMRYWIFKVEKPKH